MGRITTTWILAQLLFPLASPHEARADRDRLSFQDEIRKNHHAFRTYIDLDPAQPSRLLVSGMCGLFFNTSWGSRVCGGFPFCIANPDGSYSQTKGDKSTSLILILRLFHFRCTVNDSAAYGNPTAEGRSYVKAHAADELGEYLTPSTEKGVVLRSEECALFANEDHSFEVCDGFLYCVANPDGTYRETGTTSDTIKPTLKYFDSNCT